MPNKLLKTISARFPLSFRPFQELAQELGMKEEECLAQIKALKLSGVVKGITGFFDSRSLGYKAALIAFKSPENKLEKIAEIVNYHPGVSHNFYREGEYNLWFALHLPREKNFLEEVERLACQCEVKDFLFLPAVEIFKLATPINPSHPLPVGESNRKLFPIEVEAVKLLQKDLPLIPEPFTSLTLGAKINAGELLEIGQRFLRERIMRRYAARLNYVKAGLPINALGCFEVPPEKIKRVADFLVSQSKVSHCYLRESYPHWRYNLYVMFHGSSREELISQAEMVGFPYKLLFSVKEYKREPVKYFSE